MHHLMVEMILLIAKDCITWSSSTYRKWRNTGWAWSLPLITNIYYKKTTWTYWNFRLHPRRVSAVDNFPTRWCSSTLGFTRSSVFGCNISIWRDCLTPWPPRSPDITTLTSFYGGMLRTKCFREHVERNWLSIRRSPCNKRSTRWSVIMCCKKNFLSYIFNKKYMFVFHVQ